LGQEAADATTKYFGGQYIKLTMEKVISPFLLLKKKKYAGIKYEGLTDKGKLFSKGLEAVRRDTSPFVAKIYNAMLDAIIVKKDVLLAQKILHDRLCDLEDNKVPIEEFQISCQLKAKYKNVKLPQLTVVDKMKGRNPGSEPTAGERFQYVFVDLGREDAATFEKAEETAYARDMKLPIDRLHYLEALKNPISSLLEAFTDDCSILFKRTEAVLREIQRPKTGDIRKFMQFEAPAPPTERSMPQLPPKSAPAQPEKRRTLDTMFGGTASTAAPIEPPKKKTKKKTEAKPTANLLSFLKA